MTRQIAETGPTLIPYLENRDLGLRLKLGSIDSKTNRASILLSAIEAPGPFAQILEGFITADGHNRFSDVFALVQPDTYLFSPSELNPVTNIDVEQLWQQAWASICKDPKLKEFVLPIQISANDRFVALRSIFQCRFKQLLFHPLCPECGQALTLCRDDEILSSAGLQGYSQSLQRYLSCPACQMGSRDAAVFYTLHEPADSPSQLQNSRQLIEGFRHLLAKDDLASDFPCVGCDETATCFGSQKAIHKRIKPLFFYPFFLILQPAPKLNLLEFLELIAGAEYERVVQNLIRKNKSGRLRKFQQLKAPLTQGSGFLCDSSAYLFLEVLYLKLCLLDEVSVLISQLGGEPTEPVKSNSLESIWVDLPDQPARLPLFWCFSLRLIDRVGRPSKTSILSDVRKRHFLGLVWYYTLLVDDKQDMKRVRAALNKVIPDTQALEKFKAGLATQLDEVFAPQHLLRPEIASFPLEWTVLWGRTLALGADLLQSGRSSVSPWSSDLFHKRFKVLKDEIRHLLLSRPTQPIRNQNTLHAEIEEGNGEVSHIDGKNVSISDAIIEDRPQSAKQQVQGNGEEISSVATQPTDTLPRDNDGDGEKTVILTQPVIFEMDKSCVTEESSEPTELEKTLVLAPVETSASKINQPAQGRNHFAPTTVGVPLKNLKSAMDSSLLETISEPLTEDDLEETVIIRPAKPNDSDENEAAAIESGKESRLNKDT